MSMTDTAQRPIRLAGSTLGVQRHACAFFSDRDEEYELLMPFIKEGIESGDRAFHIVDPALQQDHRDRLQRGGVATGNVEERGQLEVRNWNETYSRGGHFDRDAMIGFVEEVLESGKREGVLTRLVAHVQWTLADRPRGDDLLEYEVRIGSVLPRYNDPVICVYDSSKIGAGLALDILRTHPIVILGGVMQENPFFAPPEVLLREIRLRDERAGRI
jgi:hypothetical protein